MNPLRVLIVSENISMMMGGESSLPFYYAKLFLQRGVRVKMACHSRVRDEVESSFAAIQQDLYFIEDTAFQKFLFRMTGWLPYRLKDLIVGQFIHYSTQYRLRRLARKLAQSGDIDIVLEPSPITPKGLSFMYGLGVPVVIGPMCGGMTFPPAFRTLDSLFTRLIVNSGRAISTVANHLFPGKIEADVLLVANAQTRSALPRGCKGRVIQIYESGVDLDIWQSGDLETSGDSVRFVFSGRFVDLKGIQYLIPAFQKAASVAPNAILELIGGGGELQPQVEHLTRSSDVAHRVRIHGWVPRETAAEIIRSADVFVMPSLRECGGTAILEAMALGKPVITTNWGGPADYVDGRCGILVDPESPDGFIEGLASAIVQLSRDSDLRRKLGNGGQQRVQEDYLSWDAKADRVLDILLESSGKQPGPAANPPA